MTKQMFHDFGVRTMRKRVWFWHQKEHERSGWTYHSGIVWVAMQRRFSAEEYQRERNRLMRAFLDRVMQAREQLKRDS